MYGQRMVVKCALSAAYSGENGAADNYFTWDAQRCIPDAMESLLPLTQTASAVGKNIVAGLNENQLLGLPAVQACKPIAIQLEVETQLDRGRQSSRSASARLTFWLK